MVALTGVERAKGQFSPVQLGLTHAFYVELVPPRPRKTPHGRLASSLGRHLRPDSGPSFPDHFQSRDTRRTVKSGLLVVRRLFFSSLRSGLQKGITLRSHSALAFQSLACHTQTRPAAKASTSQRVEIPGPHRHCGRHRVHPEFAGGTSKRQPPGIVSKVT
jgi:hypothetical protein